jgi:hypothetical protein
MKRRILLSAMALFGFASNAQSVPGSVTMGPSYGNQVYYKFSDQTTNAYANTSWDIAFNRQSAMTIGIRSNDAKGIAVFEASADLADWANVDVTQESSWTQLYNSETTWAEGAFDHGSATYGWGEYNIITHHVDGTIIFVLKYADNTYKKLKVTDFWSGYTFTYSTWDGAAWTADQEVVLPNSDNTDRLFNYYSLQDNAAVVAEPAATDWDLIFTKYVTDYFGDGTVMYPVTGVLHHPDVKTAENNEPGGTGDTSALTFSPDINTIGYDWKTFTGSTYTVDPDKAFYVKKMSTGSIYRLVFNTFEGSSTGVVTFNQQDVTALLGSQQFENSVSFGVYPNPSLDKKISVVYDAPSYGADKNTISIFTLTGAKVYEAKLASAGFNNTAINLESLTSGVYILKFESGNYSATKKIVLQ